MQGGEATDGLLVPKCRSGRLVCRDFMTQTLSPVELSDRWPPTKIIFLEMEKQQNHFGFWMLKQQCRM